MDFILIKSQFRRLVKSAKTYPEAEVDSDHNPVVIVMKTKRFMTIEKTTANKNTGIKQLKSETIKNTVNESPEVKIRNISENPTRKEAVEELCKNITTAIKEIQSESRKQHWIKEETLKIMDKRRVAKQDPVKYKETHTHLRQACSKARAGKCS